MAAMPVNPPIERGGRKRQIARHQGFLCHEISEARWHHGEVVSVPQDLRHDQPVRHINRGNPLQAFRGEHVVDEAQVRRRHRYFDVVVLHETVKG